MMRYLLMVFMVGFWVSPAYAFTPEFLGALAGGGAATGCDDGILADGCFSSTTNFNWSPVNTNFSVSGGVATFTNNGAYYGEFTFKNLEESILAATTYNYSITIDSIIGGGGVKLLIGSVMAPTRSSAGTYTGTITTSSTSVPKLSQSSNTPGYGASISHIKIWR